MNFVAGMELIEEMSDADVAEVRESARLFEGVDQATLELRRVLDFLQSLRWLTAGMKKKQRAEDPQSRDVARFESQSGSHRARR